MPELGEIQRGRDIGKQPRQKYVWCACVDCGKERWVQFLNGEPRSLRCRSCFQKGNRNHRWKDGELNAGRGYVKVKLSPNDFFYPMAGERGYVLEHRLVVAKALGRCLHSWEIVHHKGIRYTDIRNKSDNRYPENLEIMMDLGHKQLTILECKIDKLLKEQTELKQEIRLLRLQVSELTSALQEKLRI